MSAASNSRWSEGLHWLADGWRRLQHKAVNALTLFTPERGAGTESASSSDWGMLAADVGTHGDRMVVELEVPGMREEDLSVEIDGELLTIAGVRRHATHRVDGHMHVLERAFGRFRRVIQLPAPGTRDGARAEYRRGVLHVEVPRADGHAGRRIEVRSG